MEKQPKGIIQDFLLNTGRTPIQPPMLMPLLTVISLVYSMAFEISLVCCLLQQRSSHVLRMLVKPQ